MPDGRLFIPSQCNNMYIFPGVGLAASVAGVTHITDRMLYKAAEACTNSMTKEENDEGSTFPHVKRIREVNKNVAVAVVEEDVACDMTTKIGKRQLAEGYDLDLRGGSTCAVSLPIWLCCLISTCLPRSHRSLRCSWRLMRPDRRQAPAAI